MSCTFWNMRRRKAALAAKETAKEAEPVKSAEENEAEPVKSAEENEAEPVKSAEENEAEPVKSAEENEAEKKPAKKGGGKRGK